MTTVPSITAQKFWCAPSIATPSRTRIASSAPASRAAWNAITFAAALSIAACAEDAGDKEAVGTLVGAGLGGLAGSQVGSGSGKLAAVGVGVLLGGLLGRHVGKSLDRADRIAADHAAQQSFEHERIGTTTSWSNPDSGHSGTFTPTRTYQTARGQPPWSEAPLAAGWFDPYPRWCRMPPAEAVARA